MEGTEAYLTDLIWQVHSTNITLDWEFWYHASRIKDGELGLGSNQTFQPQPRGPPSVNMILVQGKYFILVICGDGGSGE